MRNLYEIFQAEDKLWHAKFAPRIAKELGPAAAFIIRAQSPKTAKELAGILVTNALATLKREKRFITKKGKTTVLVD